MKALNKQWLEEKEAMKQLLIIRLKVDIIAPSMCIKCNSQMCSSIGSTT